MENIRETDSSPKTVIKKVIDIRRVPAHEKSGGIEAVLVDGGEYPLPNGHSIEPGMDVEIISHTVHHESGGSATTFEIKQVMDRSQA